MLFIYPLSWVTAICGDAPTDDEKFYGEVFPLGAMYTSMYLVDLNQLSEPSFEQDCCPLNSVLLQHV